jgi:hypothetical protein
MTDSRGDGAHTVAHKDQGNLDPGHVRTIRPGRPSSFHDTRSTSIGLGSSVFVRHCSRINVPELILSTSELSPDTRRI